MESWFLDGKRLNSAEMVLINFWAHSLQIAILYSKAQNSEKICFFSPNPIKMRLLGYFGM